MKILIINSSFKGDKGSTYYLSEKLLEGARQAGAVGEIINLSKYRINHCIDCQTCQKPDHFLKCIYSDKDDVQMIYNKMKEADFLIFATPVYTFNMSSLLKMLLERYYGTAKVGEFNFTKSGLFFHNVDGSICKKPFGVIITCDNLERETTINIERYFKTYAKFMDTKLSGILVRKSCGIFRFDEYEKFNKEAIPITGSVVNAYVQAGKEIVTIGKIKKSTVKKANEPIAKIPPFVKYLIKLGIGKKEIIKKHDEIMQNVINRE